MDGASPDVTGVLAPAPAVSPTSDKNTQVCVYGGCGGRWMVGRRRLGAQVRGGHVI